MEFYYNELDEPRVLWNKYNPLTWERMTNHLTSTKHLWTKNAQIYEHQLKETCFISSKTRPWCQLNRDHGVLSHPNLPTFTTDLLPIFSHSRYGSCFGDIRVC